MKLFSTCSSYPQIHSLPTDIDRPISHRQGY